MKEEKEEKEEKKGKAWRVAFNNIHMEKRWRKNNKQGNGGLYQQSHFNLLERRLSKEE